MNLVCTAINSAWFASCFPEARRFQKACKNPEQVQSQILRNLIRRNYATAFGREHRFASIQSYEDFVKRVPLRSYEEIGRWIARVRKGELSVLTTVRVTHFIPTGGSTSARKLIPFTARLQREFNAAIAPWMCDLFRTMPTLLGGPAYWSITPNAAFEHENAPVPSAVPIGFASDADYLGGMKAKLVEAVMVRPAAGALTENLSEFRFATLVALLRARDLRLISVWHPSFLTLLLDDLAENWNLLHAEMPNLPRVLPADLRELWPRITLISCWGDAHAESGTRDLARRFPGVTVQTKGLLATEGCVSIPFGGKHPLAITSHFLEFIDAAGESRLAHELEEGQTYEVVLTTGGGLWRYKLGDRVIVDGFVSKNPSIRFVGRTGQVSDLCGEKLSEEFVAGCIRQLGTDFRFAMLAPCCDAAPPNYVFIIEAPDSAACGAQLEKLLCANPHYRYARELGQLGPLQVQSVPRNAYSIYSEQLVARGQRLGDIKPVALAKDGDWPKIFSAHAV